MWFDEMGEVYELFKGSFPLSFLLFLPLFIMVSPVGAAQEFTAYRMQHYDLHGSHHGCRNAIVNVEARSVHSSTYTRRCIIARLSEMTSTKFKEMQAQNAGGLLVLLPETTLVEKERERLLELESELLVEDTNMPVYFAHETPQITEIYDAVTRSASTDSADSALDALLGSVSANGFQMVINGPQAKALNDFQITNIQGKLPGHGIEEQLPTIAIVTHYDTFGIAPGLATGADSNGSGVVVLLELARIFSKLHMSSRTHAKFNILFLLSGGGKFNYQGTKKWIDDSLENTESSLLSEVQFVLCLDTLGRGANLTLHVSKPPKPGTHGASLLKNLEDVTKTFHPDVNFSFRHKKINLADDMLAWEHERFSIRKLPAFTISHLNSHEDLARNSITDVRSSVDTTVLIRNIKIIAEALARHIYNLNDKDSMEIFQDSLSIQEGMVVSLLDAVTSQSRATQVLHKNHILLSTLEQYLSHYTREVKRSYVRADKRDPDFVFYDGVQYTMFAYSVKPAIFDLFIALGIAGYLGLVYLMGQHYHSVYSFLLKRMATNGSKTSKIH